MYFDQCLTWQSHVKHICNKLRSIAAMMYHLRGRAPFKVKLTVYKALAESLLSYGITLYGTCSENKKQEINRVIRKIVKSITYGTALDSVGTKEKYQALGILPMKELFKCVVLKNHYFTKEFRVAVRKSVALRKTERYVKPRVYTNYGKRVRNYYVPEIFNELTDELCTINTKWKLNKAIAKWCGGLINTE